MREFLLEMMGGYARELVFVHVLSAVLWVGGMIAMRVFVVPSLNNIKDDSIRVARLLEMMKKFFHISFIVSFFIVLTAIVFIVGLNLKFVGGVVYQMALIKEAIWMIMFGVLIFLYIKRNKAQRCFVSGDIDVAKKHISTIDKFVLINIVLGLIAIYLGVALRGY